MTIIYQNPLSIRKREDLINQQVTRQSANTSHKSHQAQVKFSDDAELQETLHKSFSNDLSTQSLLPIILSSCYELDDILLPTTIAHALHALTPTTYFDTPLSISVLATALHDLKSQIQHLSEAQLLQRLEGFLPAVDKLEEVRRIITEDIESCGHEREKEEQREWLEKMWEVVNDRCVVLYEGFEELESAL